VAGPVESLTPTDSAEFLRQARARCSWRLFRRTAALVGAGLGLIALSTLVDEPVGAWFRGAAPHGTIFRRVLKMPAHLFEWRSYLILGAFLAAHPDRRRLLAGLLIPVLSCTGLLHLLKLFIGRARPDVGYGPYCFVPLGDQAIGFDGFPSGHTMMAVLLVALLFLYFRRMAWVLLPFAILAAFGRIAVERHHLSDLLGGTGLALLGVHLSVAILGRATYPRVDVSACLAGLRSLMRKPVTPVVEPAAPD